MRRRQESGAAISQCWGLGQPPLSPAWTALRLSPHQRFLLIFNLLPSEKNNPWRLV